MIASTQTIPLTRQTQAVDASEEFGCRVNTISVSELFQKYQELGFLYPEKMQRLGPYLNVIQHNWSRAMQAGEELIQVVTFEDAESAAWASIVDWRTSETGWWSQHLVSAGKPVASRAVMLAAQVNALRRGGHESDQNWFRPNNKMPKRIFGSIEESLGQENASVDCYNYFAVKPENRRVFGNGIRIVPCNARNADALADFARDIKGDVYVQAEDLDTGDVEMTAIDEIYRDAGMRRYRRAWLAVDVRDQVVAALIAYRGPLGLNFSFLENRADLLIRPGASDATVQAAVEDLVTTASSAYADFEPGYIPVIACDKGAAALTQRGDECIRQYCQSIWLRPGYQAWYDHTNSFYSRIMRRLERRGRAA